MENPADAIVSNDKKAISVNHKQETRVSIVDEVSQNIQKHDKVRIRPGLALRGASRTCLWKWFTTFVAVVFVVAAVVVLVVVTLAYWDDFDISVITGVGPKSVGGCAG